MTKNDSSIPPKARNRIAFGNSVIRSLGSEDAMVIGHGSPIDVSKYRSPNSFVGKHRTPAPSQGQ